jgi:hypothetical protein
MTREFRYPPQVVAAGYGRSAFGLSISLGPLLFLQPTAWMIPVLIAGGALFLVYTATVVARHTACFALGDSGIEARGLFGGAIAWSELRSVELNYYSTRNDRSNGWIELVARGARSVIRIESVIDGFPAIAERIAREALKHNVPLDERTRMHLTTIGIDAGALLDLDVRTLRGVGHA